MNQTVKEIEKLKRQISIIEFSDYLSYEDKEAIANLEKQIAELESQIKGLKGIAVHVTYKDKVHFGNAGWYLTDNAGLCCSDEPVLFDSREEAQEYLDKAKLDQEQYDVEFVEVTLA